MNTGFKLPDMSIFSTRDVADIALQRTSGLANVPKLGSISYRAWNAGLEAPLLVEAAMRRKAIISNAFHEISVEFEKIANFLKGRPVDAIMDIGCGHGLVNLLFHQRYDCSIHLVDVETTEAKHHEFHDTGAGYGSLGQAREYLEINGVPKSAISTTNPKSTALADSNLDVILSMFSAGFHYPIAEYTEFALKALKPGGVLIFDLRQDSEQDAFFESFPRYDVIESGLKHRRIAAFK